jgi:electron transport complex protein RnfG
MIRLIVRYVVVLTVICTVAAATLATVYEVTKDPIAASRAAVVREAIATVLPPFDTVVEAAEARAALGGEGPDIYPAYKDGRLIGAAVKVTDPKGYGGDVTLMVGVTAEGAVHAIRVLAHKETPGLGSKMGEEKFAGQLRGAQPGPDGLRVAKDGGTIQAISGATISSRAALGCVNAAVAAFRAAADKLPAPPAAAPAGAEPAATASAGRPAAGVTAAPAAPAAPVPGGNHG